MAKFFIRMICTAFILGICLTGTANSATKSKDTLVIGMTQFPSTFHPTIDSMLAKTYILAMTQRPFTLYNPDWEVTCLLCTELPSIEKNTARVEERPDGTKGMAVTYTIQPDATWGDGTPITTKDVLFSWEVGKHPQTGVSNFELYANDIIDITVLDEKTFTIHTDKVTCEYQSIDDFRVLPEHLERAVFEEDPVTYKERTLYDTDRTNAGLYFGPYKITAVQPGASVTLTKNPAWWGTTPGFEKIIIKTIENSAALAANLLSGEIDYIAGELGMPLDQALSFEKRIKRSHPGKFDIRYKPGLVYEHIDLNQDNPLLQDKRVRQALLYAIDRKAISQQLFAGKQPVAHSNINPLDSVYSEDISKHDYNPAMTATLLSDAGWQKGPDGIWMKDGQKLSLTLMTTAGNKSRELVQQAIQSNWRAAGIESRIDNQTARVFFGQTTRERKFKDTAMYAWLSSPRNIPRTTLHSSMVPTKENNFAGQNYPGFKHAEMDQVLDDMEVVCETDKNQALWNRAQQIYTEELPALPLYFRADAYITPKWLTGIVPTGHQYPTTYWVENWKAE